MDRQLDLLADSVRTNKKAIENPDLVDTHILTSYLDEIRSYEGELQGLKKDILSLEDIRERVRKASDIKGTLFDLWVAILHLTECVKKQPSPEVIAPPMLAGVYLTWIEIPTFDESILNWRLFWEQFRPPFTISCSWGR